MNQLTDRELSIDLLAAYRRLTYADQMTLAAQYVEILHRVGAMDDAGNPYTLTSFLADVCETWHYDIKPTDEFETMLATQAEQLRADQETCNACPTHCTDPDDDDPIAPTYHGITRIRCNGCGYETRRRSAMEIWNDIAGTCPRCDADPLDITYDRADGTSVRVHGPADDPELTDVIA